LESCSTSFSFGSGADSFFIYYRLKRVLLILVFSLIIHSGRAQYVFEEGKLPKSVSILYAAKIANVGNDIFSITQVIQKDSTLNYRFLTGNFGNLGFTNDNYWLKFKLRNDLSVPLTYYLETAEPVTNNVDCYFIDEKGKIEVQNSGDNLHFSDRAVGNRKILFRIDIAAHELKLVYISLRNDGEKNTLPLILHSQDDLLSDTYHEQLLFGFFYGILVTIAITYLFFFFALKERVFLYYSLYVVFTGLCHAALDGFFHQYILQQNSWLNLHAVILFAIIGSYFFGKYSEIVLRIRTDKTRLHQVFKGLYFLLGLTLAGVILFPSFLRYSYPLVNIFTLCGMIMILIAIADSLLKSQPIDKFYVSGISILFVCFTAVILLNFGISYNSIFLDNISKIGIALELIALSLSMANRIRELKSKKEELQDVALQRAREMNDIKSYFLSNMSHELRTPLNAIIGLTHLMDEDITDPKLKANFELIKQASSNLISSVNDILDFSKIEKGDLQLEYLSIAPAVVLDTVVSRFARQAADKGLIFEFNSSIDNRMLILGDPMRLDQMLNNIIHNAIKFTPRGRVTISAHSKPVENGGVKLFFSIEDTGEGIPPEKLDTVYQMFSQVEVDNKRRFGGFGIGLCVVKALVDLHLGSIKLESKLHEGTHCKIALTYALSEAAEEAKSLFPTDRFDLLHSRVLIVEDNPMNQMVLRMMLKKWNNTTFNFANDGAEGLDLMAKSDFDIVLMDLQMPVMDGYEAIEAIRNGRAGETKRNTPIIAITADLMQDTKDRVFKLGVNDYITKPVDQQLLYQKITTHLS